MYHKARAVPLERSSNQTNSYDMTSHHFVPRYLSDFAACSGRSLLHLDEADLLCGDATFSLKMLSSPGGLGHPFHNTRGLECWHTRLMNGDVASDADV